MKATKKPEARTSGSTIVNVILDMSGSMMSVWDVTIDSYNEYINGLKQDANKYKVSLTLFDTVAIEYPYTALDIKKVPKLTKAVYTPRSGTPLYDAVCSTLNKIRTKVKKTDKALVVIITDGQENSSREYTEKEMVAIKEELEKLGNWTFVYLEANQDAWDTAQKWGFAGQNVSSYHATERGTQTMSSNLTAATMSLGAMRGSTSTTQMFTKKQQKENEDTK